MTAEEIRDIALAALEDLQGIDITPLDVHDITDVTDYMIICTARSTRHAKALADNVVMLAKKNSLTHIRTEGEKECEWVLIDLNDVVVHVMLSATRDFYSLENLWEPVKELRRHD